MERQKESFRMGYHECLTETVHFLVEVEGLYSGDPLCVRLMTHMQKYFEKLNSSRGELTHACIVHINDLIVHPQPMAKTCISYLNRKHVSW